MSTIHVPLKEKLKSIPEVFGIRLNEEPQYDVLEEEGDFEIRAYQKQIRASVTISNSNFDDFQESAFKILAAFIFGENEDKKEIIEMTSPVLQTQTSPDTWKMSFILPERFLKHKVPKPSNSDIEISENKATDVAVYSYSGNNSLEKIEQHKEILLAWLDKHPKYEPTSEYFSAQYDAPFVIPFLKKNEIHVPIRSIAFV